MYLLFASLSLIPFLGVTITNKLGTTKINEFVGGAIKGSFYCLGCFILVCSLGHLTTMGNVFLNVRTTLFLLLNCLVNALAWVAYYFAIKRSPLGLFSATYLIAKVFFANLASLIFTTSVVTNGLKPLNMVIYIISLVSLLGTIIASLFSKEAKAYGSRWWIIGVCITSLLAAVVQFTVAFELPTSVIYEDVLLFYQSIFVVAAMLIASAFAKSLKEFKKVSPKELLIFFLSGVFEVGYIYLMFRAVNTEGTNIAIVNIITNAGLFVLVELYEMIIKKKKPSRFHLLLFIVLVTSMVLMCLAGLL